MNADGVIVGLLFSISIYTRTSTGRPGTPEARKNKQIAWNKGFSNDLGRPLESWLSGCLGCSLNPGQGRGRIKQLNVTKRKVLVMSLGGLLDPGF